MTQLWGEWNLMECNIQWKASCAGVILGIRMLPENGRYKQLQDISIDLCESNYTKDRLCATFKLLLEKKSLLKY